MGFQNYEEPYDHGKEDFDTYLHRFPRQSDQDKAQDQDNADSREDESDSDDEKYDSNLTEKEKERFTKTFDDYDYDIPNHDSQTRRYDNDIYVRYKSGKFAGWVDLLEGVKLFKNVQKIHGIRKRTYVVVLARYERYGIRQDKRTIITATIRRYNDGTCELWDTHNDDEFKIRDIKNMNEIYFSGDYIALEADRKRWDSEAESRRQAHAEHKWQYKAFLDNAFYEYLSIQHAKIVEKLDALQKEPNFVNDLDPIHIEIEEIETIMEQVKQKLESLRQVLFPSSTTGAPGLRVMLARLQQMS